MLLLFVCFDVCFRKQLALTTFVLRSVNASNLAIDIFQQHYIYSRVGKIWTNVLFLHIRDDSHYLLTENLSRHNVCALHVVILLRAIHHQFCDLLYPSKDHKLENPKTQWIATAFSYVTWRRARLTEINTYRLKLKL